MSARTVAFWLGGLCLVLVAVLDPATAFAQPKPPLAPSGPAAPPGFRWAAVQGGAIPADAVSSGQVGGAPAYVCRAVHQRQVLPGQVVGSQCVFPLGNSTIGEPGFEVLVGNRDAVKWIAGSDGQLPAGAVVAGSISGHPQTVCRAADKDGVYPGRMGAGSSCIIAPGKHARIVKTYEVLVISGAPAAAASASPPAAAGPAGGAATAATEPQTNPNLPGNCKGSFEINGKAYHAVMTKDETQAPVCRPHITAQVSYADNKPGAKIESVAIDLTIPGAAAAAFDRFILTAAIEPKVNPLNTPIVFTEKDSIVSWTTAAGPHDFKMCTVMSPAGGPQSLVLKGTATFTEIGAEGGFVSGTFDVALNGPNCPDKKLKGRFQALRMDQHEE